MDISQYIYSRSSVFMGFPSKDSTNQPRIEISICDWLNPWMPTPGYRGPTVGLEHPWILVYWMGSWNQYPLQILKDLCVCVCVCVCVCSFTCTTLFFYIRLCFGEALLGLEKHLMESSESSPIRLPPTWHTQLSLLTSCTAWYIIATDEPILIHYY